MDTPMDTPMDKDTPHRPTPEPPTPRTTSGGRRPAGGSKKVGGPKKQSGAARLGTALAMPLALFICAMFPYAFYVNTVALIDGYRASHGSVGTPGTVVVVGKARAKSTTICRGDFTPADGGPTVRAQVELPGPCRVGDRHPARLMEPTSNLFDSYDEPTAWVPGSTGWTVYIFLVLLFGLLTFGPVLLFVGAFVYGFRSPGKPKAPPA